MRGVTAASVLLVLTNTDKLKSVISPRLGQVQTLDESRVTARIKVNKQLLGRVIEDCLVPEVPRNELETVSCLDRVRHHHRQAEPGYHPDGDEARVPGHHPGCFLTWGIVSQSSVTSENFVQFPLCFTFHRL